MRKIFYISILLISLFLTKANANSYDMSLPLEGNSIANDSLQFLVLKELYPITSKLNPLCINHKVTNTQIIHYPYDVKKKNNKYVKGYWKELWTVNYCGQKVQVPVTFQINNNSTDFEIDDNLILP